MATVALLLGACGAPATKAESPRDERPTDSVAKDAVTLPWPLSTIRDPRLFTAPDGTKLEIAPVDSTTDRTLRGYVLARISGTPADHDEVVLVAHRRTNGYYYTSIRGQPVWIFHQDMRSARDGGNPNNWNLPRQSGRRDPTTLQPEDGSKVDGEELLARLRAQHASGLMAKLAPADRKGREAAQQGLVDEYMQSENAPCGALKMVIDWESVEDAWFDEFSIESRCTRQIDHLQSFCNLFPQTLSDLRATGPVRCTFRGSPSDAPETPLHRGASGELVFVPSRDSPKREQFVFLRRLFGESQQVLRGKTTHFIIRDEEGRSQALYNGDGNTFYPNGHFSEKRGSTSRRLRHSSILASLERDDDQRWSLVCGGVNDKSKTEELETLRGKERDAILAGAIFKKEPKWLREPYFLARDTRGIYYYVDKYHHEFGGKRYRVFTGRRGQLKLTKLKGVVEDSVGTVFSTDAGELRLVVSQKAQSAQWIRGKKTLILTTVGVHNNRKLIYDELGAYFGEDLGFVCDK